MEKVKQWDWTPEEGTLEVTWADDDRNIFDMTAIHPSNVPFLIQHACKQRGMDGTGGKDLAETKAICISAIERLYTEDGYKTVRKARGPMIGHSAIQKAYLEAEDDIERVGLAKLMKSQGIAIPEIIEE